MDSHMVSLSQLVVDRARSALDDHFRSMQGLMNLYSMLQVRHPMPLTGKWAASPDLLAFLVSHIQRSKPSTVVDLGSGASTVWMATAIRDGGAQGRIVSVDHDAEFVARTSWMLRDAGLEHLVDIRHSSLATVDVLGESIKWYRPDTFDDIPTIDLLLVDGPPSSVYPMSRLGAVPILFSRLGNDAVVVVDDYGRPEERDVVKRWASRYPELEVRELDHEKGTAVLTFRRRSEDNNH
jgi:predicted O-methyltransferase YrrM